MKDDWYVLRSRRWVKAIHEMETYLILRDNGNDSFIKQSLKVQFELFLGPPSKWVQLDHYYVPAIWC